MRKLWRISLDVQHSVHMDCRLQVNLLSHFFLNLNEAHALLFNAPTSPSLMSDLRFASQTETFTGLAASGGEHFSCASNHVVGRPIVHIYTSQGINVEDGRSPDMSHHRCPDEHVDL